MARLGSEAKMGYYPTPYRSLDEIKRHIVIDFKCKEKKFHFLDPCCGEGDAVNDVAYWATFDHYTQMPSYDNYYITWGIELDIERANKALRRLDNVVQSSIFDVRINPLGCMGLLWLNPPYSSDSGERVEMKFLKHSIKWLCPNGVLVFIIPEHILANENTRLWIGQHFKGITIRRLHRDDYPRFKQVVLFGIKRKEGTEEGEFILPPPYEEYIEDLRLSSPYVVPPTEGPNVFQGTDAVTEEDIRKNRPKLMEEIEKIVGRDKDKLRLRPLFPLRRGHLVSLITAGILDGKIETPDGGYIIMKGFSDRIKSTHFEDEAEIILDTYSVGIRIIEKEGKWYDIR